VTLVPLGPQVGLDDRAVAHAALTGSAPSAIVERICAIKQGFKVDLLRLKSGCDFGSERFVRCWLHEVLSVELRAFAVDRHVIAARVAPDRLAAFLEKHYSKDWIDSGALQRIISAKTIYTPQ
jgi:hypothetical protein